MGIRNQKVGNVLILMSFRNGLPRRPVGPPRNDRLFRQSRLPPSRGPIPLVKGKCPEGTKGIGKVAPKGPDEGEYR